MSLGKIGLHILNGFTGNLGRPHIVKLVDPSPTYIRDVRKLVGDACTLVIRWTEAVQPLSAPVQNARDWFARRRPSMVDARALYEGYNEVADEQAAPFAAFELERLRMMHGDGLRSAVGSWSVGVPDIPVWATYAPVLAAMRDGDAVSLHEYWIDGPDVGNQWHVGRWRLVPELDNTKIVVTECGRDRVEGRGYSGWHLDPHLTAGAYLDELRAYGALLDAEPRVLGATVFTAGQITDAQWQPFEVNSIAAQITAESTQAAPVVVPPVTPPVVPAGAKVIMPIVNTGKAWYSADAYFGPYDDHPARARDWNLEAGGNSDLGEPLQFPCDGTVVYAGNAGRGHGNVVSFVTVLKGVLWNLHWKHLQRLDVKQWAQVKQGQLVGTVGNADGYYAGAHVHEEAVRGAITGPTQDWRDPAFEYVDPAEFYIAHGVDAALVDRMTQYDGR